MEFLIGWLFSLFFISLVIGIIIQIKDIIKSLEWKQICYEDDKAVAIEKTIWIAKDKLPANQPLIVWLSFNLQGCEFPEFYPCQIESYMSVFKDSKYQIIVRYKELSHKTLLPNNFKYTQYATHHYLENSLF